MGERRPKNSERRLDRLEEEEQERERDREKGILEVFPREDEDAPLSRDDDGEQRP